MKYLTGILLLLMMQAASATQCRVDGGSWFNIGGSVRIDVNVKATPGSNMIFMSGYTLECRFDLGGGAPGPGNLWDEFNTRDAGLVPGEKFMRHKMGLYTISGPFLAPINRPVYIARMGNQGTPHNLNTHIYMNLMGGPGNPINILPGDLLGTVLLRQHNNYGTPGSTLSIAIYARNSFSFEPSACTINGNRPIEVDFGPVAPLDIGDNPLSSIIQKNLMLDYSCPDPGVTTPISITLRGYSASFNDNAIAMGHKDLGTSLIRRGAVVKPGSSFLTQLTNSVGSDEVTFSLIRKSGTHPDAGVYNGSATLVMGVP